MKKIAWALGAILVFLLLAAVAVPYFFKDELVAKLKTEINNNLTAKVDFRDVDVSLFRHFPKLTVGLKQLTVAGTHDFAKDTLLQVATLDVAVNLMSVVKGDEVQVHGVYLKKPVVHAIVKKDGRANWDIVKPSETTNDNTANTGTTLLQLERYSIEDATIRYTDEQSNMAFAAHELNHSGSGALGADVFTVATKTAAQSVAFNYGGVPYLIDVAAGIDAAIAVDMGKARYSFNKATVRLNNLQVQTDGFVQVDNDSTYSMDLKFGAAQQQFKDLLSLVPALYTKDFTSLKTSGAAGFSGWVKGVYSAAQMPAYDVAVQVKDGYFQYPDLPQAVKNVQVDARFSNATGAADDAEVLVKNAHLEMGGQPVDLKLLFRNPETAQYIDAVVKGNINLSALNKFVKLPEGTQLSGMVAADAFAKGSMQALGSAGNVFTAGGFFKVAGLNVQSTALGHPITDGRCNVQLTNNGGTSDATTIAITDAYLKMDNQPLQFSLNITKPFSTLFFDGSLNGRFLLEDVSRFTTLPAGTQVSGTVAANVQFAGNKAAVDAGRYNELKLNGSAQGNNIMYRSPDYPQGVSIKTAQLQFTEQWATLQQFSGTLFKTNIQAQGRLENLLVYAVYNATLKGNIALQADAVDLNEWMSSSTTATEDSTATSTAFVVPDKLDLVIDAAAGNVHYDKVDYQHVKGRLLVANEAVTLQDVQTEALAGKIKFNGQYSTRSSKTAPQVAMSYDVSDIDVQQAFYAYNTVQKIMPLGQFLSGRLSSQFKMTGSLKGDLMPELSSLTGGGNLLLLQGVLRKFAPAEELANKLNVDALRDIHLKDIKSRFEFANGKVLVKPFDVQVKDIALQIGGVHHFDQSLEYLIGMNIPRKYMGTAGNNLVNSLADAASKKGVAVQVGETVRLNVVLAGTLTRPLIKTELKEAAGDVKAQLQQQATAFIQQKQDSIKAAVRDTVAAVKKQMITEAKNEVIKSLTGTKDSNAVGTSAALQQRKEQAVEGVKKLSGLFKKKKE